MKARRETEPFLTQAACAVLGLIAWTFAAYTRGHIELTCERVARTRVDARLDVYNWFDQLPHTRFDYTDITDAEVSAGKVYLTNGEISTGGGPFPGDTTTALQIEMFIVKSKVGQSLRLTVYESWVPPLVFAIVGTLLLWAAGRAHQWSMQGAAGRMAEVN